VKYQRQLPDSTTVAPTILFDPWRCLEAGQRQRGPAGINSAAPTITAAGDISMPTILLLCLSNVFMTYAWYGHLKYLHDKPVWLVVLISWGIAFFEYCLMVPANRLGYGTYTGFQLKVIQEIITLVVFSVFAILVLKEKLAWNYVASFAFIMMAVVFAFGFKATAQ